VRDIQHVLPVLIPFALYASPVACDIAEIPARFQQLMYLANQSPP
jgi:ABC-type polysaccharide/polyol phosphate export permease